MLIASALLLAACGGSSPSATPQAKTERAVRQLAAKQRISLKSVHCSRLNKNGYGCTGRTTTGGTYSCSMGIFVKRVEGACFLRPQS
jgi:hypothetical protein